MNELALFAGAGGGILGGHLLGWRTVAAVEWEPYAASVLVARQNDGLLPPFPIWDDVRTFDGRPFRGVVDVVSGGFPCQDISRAGKGAGIEGARSGMWAHMARIIGEVRPSFAFVENSPDLVTRGLGRVLSDLAALGYDCRWTVLGADDVGAPHRRDRFWLVAHASGERHGPTAEAVCAGWHAVEPSGANVADAAQLQRDGGKHDARGGMGSQPFPQSGNGGGTANVADANQFFGHERRAGDAGQRQGGRHPDRSDVGQIVSDAMRQRLEGKQQAGPAPWTVDGPQRWGDPGWWSVEPGVGRVVDGLATRVDELKALGNGQVPLCAATAWRMLTGG